METTFASFPGEGVGFEIFIQKKPTRGACSFVAVRVSPSSGRLDFHDVVCMHDTSPADDMYSGYVLYTLRQFRARQKCFKIIPAHIFYFF